MSNIITPVLLAGGAGTRLWPLSRKSYPKQFSNIFDEKSLFQKTALRFMSSANIEFEKPITMTNEQFRFIVGEQLYSTGIEPGPIVIEPVSKNTAPAILAASVFATQNSEDPILLIAPSDHVIPDIEAFQDSLMQGLDLVAMGKFVTFGISPTRPETGYGYLELSKASGGEAVELLQFVEKPQLAEAQEMLKSGNYLWNSGIFMFRASDMVNAFRNYQPELLASVMDAVDTMTPDLDFLRLDTVAYSKCENISIDFAIMEKANNLVAIPFDAGWSDLGDWNAVMQEMQPDENGVATSLNAHAIDCENTMLRSENESLEIVGLGLENIIAVAMSDAVLIADRSKTQDVKKIIDKLKSKNLSQAESFSKDHRPWGWFEAIAMRGRFQVKRIFVKPGAALSLQSHHHRSEHWIIVEGTARVTVGDQTILLTEGQSTYIPLGEIHRMENPGKVPMVLIEVQIGSYLKEDDIIRYEDIYARK